MRCSKVPHKIVNVVFEENIIPLSSGVKVSVFMAVALFSATKFYWAGFIT